MGDLGNTRHKLWFSVFLAGAGSVGGFLFGYDLGVISGSLPLLSDEFELSDVEEEMVVALQAVGSVLGACIGGYVCDRIGRLKTVCLCVCMFIVGSVVLNFSYAFVTLCVGRIIVGIGISFSSIADVSFLTEVSPTEYRGAVVATFDLGVTFGILCAYLVNNFLSSWRTMFLVPIPIAVLWFLLMNSLPESPRWLLLVEREEEALSSLTRIYGGIEEAHRWHELATISISHEKRAREVTFLDFLYRWKLQLGLVVFLMMAQQLSGNAVLLTYRPDAYSSDDDDSSDNTDTFVIILGCVKVVGTIIALYFVERIGRRILLLIGIACMSVSWIFVIIATALSIPVLAVIGACLVITAYSISFGCLSWVIVSETFPDEYRSRAIGFSMVINWLFNFVVMSSYISMTDQIMEVGAFVFYMFMCILSLTCAYYVVPETKSKDHKEINSDLISRMGNFMPSLLEDDGRMEDGGEDNSPANCDPSVISASEFESKSSSPSNSGNHTDVNVTDVYSSQYSGVHNEIHNRV